MPLPSHTNSCCPSYRFSRIREAQLAPKTSTTRSPTSSICPMRTATAPSTSASVKSTRSSDECVGHARQQYSGVLSRKTSHLCGA